MLSSLTTSFPSLTYLTSFPPTLLPPLSLPPSLIPPSCAVEAQIVQNVISHLPVPVGQPVSFSCEATGDSLTFKWLFDRQAYNDCPEHDNICVLTSISPDAAGMISGRSQLSIRDTRLLSAADSSMSFSVICQVSQRLPSQFSAALKSSEARLVLEGKSVVPHTAGVYIYIYILITRKTLHVKVSVNML